MGLVDSGTQILGYDYKDEAKANKFNRYNYLTRLPGIYSGGTLNIVNDTTVTLSSGLVAHMEDTANNVGCRVETTSLSNPITVSPTNCYVIAKFTWVDTEDNYADFSAVPYASIVPTDIVIGKCVYVSTTLTSFDYSRKSIPATIELSDCIDCLKVYANEPINKTVYVEAGYAVVNNTKIVYAGGNSPNLTDTTAGRIDLICLNSSGAIVIVEGNDNASPVQPSFPPDKLVLAIVTRGTTATTVIGDNISQVTSISNNTSFNRIRSISSLSSTFVMDSSMTESIYLCDLSTTALEITLPDATENLERILTFPFVGASTARALSFDTVSSQTINGNTPDQYKGESFGTIQLISDGANWRILSFEDSINNLISTNDLIGDYKFSAIKQDHSGYLEWTFDEVLISSYQALFDKIGYIFSADHIAISQPAPTAGYFYPTPVPGSYTRTAFPDITFANTDVVTNKINVSLVSGGFRDGSYFRYAKLTGTDITNLTDGNYYYFSYDGTDLEVWNSEADAIDQLTTPIAIASAGAGTFKLTQSGIKIADAFQNWQLGADEDSTGARDTFATAGARDFSPQNSAVAGRTAYLLDTGDQGNSNMLKAMDDGVHGTPRISNETRPISTITFGYIKAVDIDLTSGLPVSDLEATTGWIDPTSWDNQSFTITHGFNDIVLSNFDVKFYFSSDGTEANAVLISHGASQRPADTGTTSNGILVKASTANDIIVQTADGGFQILDGSGVRNVINGIDAGYYKIVVKKRTYSTQIYIPKYFGPLDLTSGSLIHALPDASTYIGDITIEWENGTIGGNNLTFTTVSGQTINGDLASVWKGEGKGIITLTSDLSNWRVKEYEDNGGDVETATGGWKKDKNKNVYQNGIDTQPTGSGAGPYTITMGYTYLNSNYLTFVDLEDNAAKFAVVYSSNKNNGSFDYRTDSAAPSGARTNWRTVGKWAT